MGVNVLMHNGLSVTHVHIREQHSHICYTYPGKITILTFSIGEACHVSYTHTQVHDQHACCEPRCDTFVGALSTLLYYMSSSQHCYYVIDHRHPDPDSHVELLLPH